MDRNRILKQIRKNGVPLDGKILKVLDTLGEGGNGVALLCETVDGERVVAKIYVPPDTKDLDEQASARFESEIKLTSKIRHPNVVQAISSGKMALGAYSLPFYIMPRAANTLRKCTGSHENDPAEIEKRMRLFVRASLGVSCLHSNGIVHRDLKPENILIDRNGTPWVADLGIAHVNPDFVSVGVKTLADERLHNRDYYAPEQRFGNASDVDSRADIYALGYILYELFAGSPPVRNSSPALGKINDAFAVLDPIFVRMTAHEPKDRYQFIEDVVEDVSVAFGWILATMKGARPAESADVPTMAKLLKSSNDAHRQRGILIAGQLGEDALYVLHELSGHSRRDIRNAAVAALGEIAHPSSLPFLIGCLYGGVNSKASTFRPAADTAAAAIGRYPADVRIRSCADLAQPVHSVQLQQILKGVPKDTAYATVQDVVARGRLLLDYGETALTLLAGIDEERAWPEILAGIKGGSINGFGARSLARVLSARHQAEFLDAWMERTKDAWYFSYILEAILSAELACDAKRQLLLKLKGKSQTYRGQFKNQADVIAAIDKALQDQAAKA